MGQAKGHSTKGRRLDQRHVGGDLGRNLGQRGALAAVALC